LSTRGPRRSITRKLVVMFALAAMATFVVIGAALYSVLDREMARHQQEELNATLQEILYPLQRTGAADRWMRLQARMDTITPPERSARFWVLSDNPRWRYGEDMDIAQAQLAHKDGLGEIVIPDLPYPMRTLSVTVDAYQDRPQVQLTVAIDGAPRSHTLRTFLIALASLTATAVLLVMLLGYWIARVGLRPLSRLSNEAQTLSPKALSQRLRISELPDELSDLAAAFNGALSRLEDAYRQMEAFNADVAHELRTPLTNLIGETQVALARQRSAPEFQEVLQSNLEELDRLRAIINDMLFLARADQGESATGLIHASLAGQIAKTIEFFEVILDEMQMTVRMEGDLDAHASIETALFRRAITNLLHNAFQHSAPGAEIVAAVHAAPGELRIAVSNPGAPIAPEHLAHMFDRFYRVDAARHDRAGHHGNGLGLAIVKAVANMHGGTVFAGCEDGVTTIGFSVPVRAA
jgi:two-component system heavy metal sensor histidine kinase CusS